MNTNHITGSKTNMNSISEKQTTADAHIQQRSLENMVNEKTTSIKSYDHYAKLKDTSFVTTEVFCCGELNDTGDFLHENEAAFTMLSGALVRYCVHKNNLGEEESWFSIEDIACAIGLYEVYGSKSLKMIADATDTDQRRTVLFGKNNKKMKVVSVSGFFAVLLKYSDRTEAGQRFMRWVTRALLPTLFEGCDYDIETAFHACDLNCWEIWNAHH